MSKYNLDAFALAYRLTDLKLYRAQLQRILSCTLYFEVLSWLSTKNCWELGELEYKLAFEYDVVYESKQSYYDLFDAASISWKKTTKLNPKADEDAVAAKKKEIETLLASNRSEIEAGKLKKSEVGSRKSEVGSTVL